MQTIERPYPTSQKRPDPLDVKSLVKAQGIMYALRTIKERGERITVFGHVFKVVKAEGQKLVLRYERKQLIGKEG